MVKWYILVRNIVFWKIWAFINTMLENSLNILLLLSDFAIDALEKITLYIMTITPKPDHPYYYINDSSNTTSKDQ